MASKKKPDYDILIPSHVLHDNSIRPGARIVYGEIAALCGKGNSCLFDDILFSGLYGVSKKTLANWVKTLADAKYISIERMPTDENSDSNKMKISLIG